MDNTEKTNFSTSFAGLLQTFFVSKKADKGGDSNLKKLSIQQVPKTEKDIPFKTDDKDIPQVPKTEKDFLKDLPIPNEIEVDWSDSDSDTFSKSDKVESVESDDVKSQLDFKPKKFLMNYSNITKNNIIIMNKTFEDSIFILTDIMKSISLMKNINEFYNDKSFIITDKQNQLYYKKIILENPQIHFTNIVYKNQLPKSKIEELSENKKKTLVIIDIDTVDEKNYLKLMSNIKANVQFIIITTKIDNDIKFIKNPLIIHYHDNKKSLQKEFFNKIIKTNTVQFKNLDFEKYETFINQETFGVRYIFLHNNEFKYC